MPFPEEVAARLVTQSVGVVNTNIFIGSKKTIPAGDGPFLSIIETGGGGPIFIHNSSTPAFAMPTAQIMVRAVDYPTARLMAKKAYDALVGFNLTLGGTFYRSIKPRQELTDQLPEDGTGRARVSFNIEADKRPS